MAGRQPNILFIISDQHNAKCLGVAGHPDARTPSLDRLSSEGTRFTNCTTQSPICTPSRVSFLSGQYVHNHGYYGLSGPEPKHLPSLFGAFRDSGYLAAAIGKIHCPDNWVEGDTDACLEAYSGPDGPYARYLAGEGVLEDRDDDRLQEWASMGCASQGLDARRSRLAFEHSVEAWAARETMRFIDNAGDKPFLIQCSLPRPHECYTPSEPYWSMYDEDTLTLPPNADYDMGAKPPHLRNVRAAQSADGAQMWLFEPQNYEAGRRRVLRGYLGCVSQVDAAVGMLLDHLDARGLAEDTIVVYTSDHGDFAGEHGIIEKAPGIGADAITRIPSIWRWPTRIQAGRACEQLAEAVDLAPTVMQLAGLDALETFDGMSLTEQLAGGNEPLREVAVTENPWSKSIRTMRWRMVHYADELFPGQDVGELYDLENDPWEMENLYHHPEHRETVFDMRGRLVDWLMTTTRPTTFHPPLVPGERAASHHIAEDGKCLPDHIRRQAERGSVNYL